MLLHCESKTQPLVHLKTAHIYKFVNCFWYKELPFNFHLPKLTIHLQGHYKLKTRPGFLAVTKTEASALEPKHQLHTLWSFHSHRMLVNSYH